MQISKKPAKQTNKPQSSQNPKLKLQPQKNIQNDPSKLKSSTKFQGNSDPKMKSSNSIPPSKAPIQHPEKNLFFEPSKDDQFQMEEKIEGSAFFPDQNAENMQKPPQEENKIQSPLINLGQEKAKKNNEHLNPTSHQMILKEKPKNLLEKTKNKQAENLLDLEIKESSGLEHPSKNSKQNRSQEKLPQKTIKNDHKDKIHEKNLENEKENKKMGFYENLSKNQILSILTDKVYVLTDELEKLSSVVAQNMEDNKHWKLKYAKLKELYIKNVEEDINPDLYFEGIDYGLDMNNDKTKSSKSFDEKFKRLTEENNKINNLLAKSQEAIEEYHKKIHNSKKNKNEIKEYEVNYQNKIKVLQNELEILRTEQNNKTKMFSEEKYEKLLKNFLTLKEEKDIIEKKYEIKLQEFDPSSSNLNSIPNEEISGGFINEKMKKLEKTNIFMEEKEIKKNPKVQAKKPIGKN